MCAMKSSLLFGLVMMAAVPAGTVLADEAPVLQDPAGSFSQSYRDASDEAPAVGHGSVDTDIARWFGNHPDGRYSQSYRDVEEGRPQATGAAIHTYGDDAHTRRESPQGRYSQSFRDTQN
jgi:hypothetical protein